MATLVAGKKKTVRINGCVAAAQAAKYADVDVITAYPIRPVHGDDDGAGADGGQRGTGRRVHRGGQRALPAEHRARRIIQRRARFHRQLRRRRAVRLRAVLADFRQPHAGADDDRRPHARSSGRLRLGAHGRALNARHGLADGLVVRRAGSVRQSPRWPSASARIRACSCRRWFARMDSSSRTSRATSICRIRAR